MWFSIVPNCSGRIVRLTPRPTQTVDLASPVTGLLEKVYVRRGDLITSGQTLATLESRAEQAANDLAKFKSEQIGPTRTAESKIEFSKRKFTRRSTMAAEKLLPKQESDDADAEFKLAESGLVVAKYREMANSRLDVPKGSKCKAELPELRQSNTRPTCV